MWYPTCAISASAEARNSAGTETDVVSENVERTVVRPSLLIESFEEIVLGDKVRSTGMQTTSHDARNEQIPQRVHSREFDEQSVESELDEEVESDPFRRCLVANESWSEGVEEDLERAVGEN